MRKSRLSQDFATKATRLQLISASETLMTNRNRRTFRFPFDRQGCHGCFKVARSLALVRSAF